MTYCLYISIENEYSGADSCTEKSCQIFEKIIIFEKISHVDMGQIFASFLQFGQFFQNMSPIDAKSLLVGSLMMLLKKTEKTLVEISRKLENPAVKRPYR